jgi:hypothetical protein
MLKLAQLLVIIETLNGFVHQGPVGGNKHQIHLSGWTYKDFKKLGFEIYGTTGMKFLKINMTKVLIKLILVI